MLPTTFRLSVCTALTAIALLLAPALASAYVVPFSIEELTAQAHTIAEVRVTEANVRAQGSGARVVRIDTDIDLRVAQMLKGSARSTLALTQPGGTSGGVTLAVSDMPEFQPGDRAIVFLDDNGVVGGAQGKLEIVDGVVPALGMTLAEARQAIREIARTGSTSVVGTAGYAVSEGVAALGSDDVTAASVGGPVIDLVSPPYANANSGDRVTIHGSGFGATRGSGRVEFLAGNSQLGAVVAAEIIHSWSDTRIEVTLPRRVQPGPVVVTTGAGAQSPGLRYDAGSAISGVSWAPESLPVSFRIAENSADTTGERAAILAAMQTWSNAGSNLRFTYGGATDTSGYRPQYDGNNDIYFTPSAEMPTGFLAQCFYWFSGSRMLESDIVFNDASFTWAVGAVSGAFDIQSVALHELGHAVGLDDQYNALDRAMGAMPRAQTRRTLSPHEVLAAMRIYGEDGTVTRPRLLAVEPIAGSSRFATAVEISKRAYPTGLAADGARTVVLATGRNWPDALGGTSLAGVLDGPVLLVDRGSVPAAVSAEIARLGAERAIILGGAGAVSADVEQAVAAQLGGVGRVERIAGASRYETADRVAARVLELLGDDHGGTAIVATGANYPDALAVSPLAAANGWPLLLAHPSRGLAPETLSVMGDPDRVLLLGGTGAVSAGVESQLRVSFASAELRRLAGTDRYSTAVAVANFGTTHAGLAWDGVAIATGQNFPDALAGGVLQANRGSVMVLTRTSSICTGTTGTLTAHRSEIDSVTYLGGVGAVCDSVRTTVGRALE